MVHRTETAILAANRWVHPVAESAEPNPQLDSNLHFIVTGLLICDNRETG
jgi:hypothetical protein